jgi:uncharacterized repeat protein (TIGR03803 family)
MGTDVFGTTMSGGANTFGSVFVRHASGKVDILYSFRGGSDGATPQGTLVALNGALFGTTEFGGKFGNGTVFKITPGGKESVVYAFKGGSDGATPVLAGMIAINGTLYGTTTAGGITKCTVENSVGCGIVFSVDASGKEHVLYRFNGRPDGASPTGSLLDVNGTIYGTTNFGGAGNNGTVYTITTSGVKHTLYAFKGYPDGAVPYAGLTSLGGNFYGTTSLGGAFNYSGTIFKLSASGTEHVLHSFSGAPDGAIPYGTLTVANGQLYGTTVYGGNSTRNCTGGGITGCGIIYAIAPTGKERTLYTFTGPPDGSNPWTGLVLVSGTLYGSTVSGGASGAGSIFKIAPSSR